MPNMKNKIIIGLLLMFYSVSVQGQIVTSAKYDGKWGFIDLEGKWFIDPKFDSLGTFYNSYAEIYLDGKEGLINHKGEIVIKPVYDFVGLVEEDMVDIMENDKIGYLNVKTKQIIQPKFEDGNEFSEGLAGVMNDNEKWGFIDKEGNLVIPFKYDDTDWHFKNDSIQVELDSKEYFINKKDEYLGDTQDYHFVKKELTLEEKRIRLKLMNQGFDTLSILFTGYRQDSIFWFQAGEKYGVADTSGQAIIQPIYDYIWYFSEGVAPVRRDDKWGFVYPNGQIAIELKYEYVTNFKYGLAAAKINDKWGYINHSGQWVIKPTLENTDGYFRDVTVTVDPIVHFER